MADATPMNPARSETAARPGGALLSDFSARPAPGTPHANRGAAANVAFVDRPRRDRGWLAVSVLMRLVVGGYFIYAASMKVMDSPEVFTKNIKGFQIVSPMWAPAMAIVMPWVEIVSAALLIVGVWVKEARLLIVLMLLVFITAVISSMIRGLPIDCGCTGKSDSPSSGWVIISRNTAFLGCLALDWYAMRRAGAGAKRA